MAKKPNSKTAKRISVWIIVIGIIAPSLMVTIKKTFDYYAQHAHRFFTPKKIFCSISNVFDQSTKDKIIQFVNARTTQESLLNFDRDIFYRNLKQEFPVIKTLTWRFLVSQALQLDIMGTTPYCIINNQYVLGDKKKLLSFDFFQATTLKSLPNIWITQDLSMRSNPSRRPTGSSGRAQVPPKPENDALKISTHLYNFLHKIPATTWAQFTIAYHSPSHIDLVPHQSICPCKIITDEKTFFSQRKFQALSAIFSDLSNQGFITKRILQAKSPLLAFDFRIKNQIIVKFYDSRGRGRNHA